LYVRVDRIATAKSDNVERPLLAVQGLDAILEPHDQFINCGVTWSANKKFLCCRIPCGDGVAPVLEAICQNCANDSYDGLGLS
jgi:hypothetical protein